ncbi:peptidoglycan D,D-transpeptidase FtsI family protein [Motilibacter aurantiacus]|uniref:peptidoglycan D,D-transpeptidase FtsI family protein n=1 Tax=Motilibacter aurantiacus TaxID=2714955 RepID=UPI001409DC9D|nr:penicillin-binding protein 2 [Motilibacter aurantiacus]
MLGFILSLFAGRLFQLQGVEASQYAAEAVDKRMTNPRVLPAVRGEILDRHGVALATSVEAYDVVANPQNVEEPAVTAKAVAPLLGLEPAKMQADIEERKAKKSKYLRLKQRVTPQLRATIRELDPTERAGIEFIKTSRRTYPADSVAANVVGFVERDGDTGRAGLELSMDSVLAGTDGKAEYEAAKGTQLPTGAAAIVEPVDGRDVVTTIDRDIQWVAQSAIAAKVKEARADWGSVVVMDAKTGEVYAMATAPTFNPNTYYKAPAAALGNYPVSANYEPGSTAKVMTVAAAIEEGKVEPMTRLTVPDHIGRAGEVFHDDEPHPTWQPTVTGVLAKSSNVGTIQIAERMSARTLDSYLRKFGMGSKPGTGLPGEENGLFPPVEDWSGSTRHTVAFGQGLAGTLLQQASVYQTLANGGVRVAPSVVKATVGPDGTQTPQTSGKGTRVVSAGTASEVMKMMEAVVLEGGTGIHAAIPGYRVAGKTGTAQIAGCGGYCAGKFQASFVGVVPADKPRLVVAVTLHYPKRISHFGGVLGAPVFKEVASFALQTLGVPPTGARSPKLNLGNVGR